MLSRTEFAVDTALGVLGAARQVRSPNFDSRPPDTRIDLIVVHGISLPPGEYGGPWIDQLFTNALAADAHPYFAQIESLRVSTHLLIRRTGEIVQYVNFNDRAWHAGRSSYAGRDACNDFSIGIELEGTDTQDYEFAQYMALCASVLALLAAYPALSIETIVGHSDIAPGRKTDPGPGFDWTYFRSLLAARMIPT